MIWRNAIHTLYVITERYGTILPTYHYLWGPYVRVTNDLTKCYSYIMCHYWEIWYHSANLSLPMGTLCEGYQWFDKMLLIHYMSFMRDMVPFCQPTIISSQHVNHPPRCTHNDLCSTLQLCNLVRKKKKKKTVISMSSSIGRRSRTLHNMSQNSSHSFIHFISNSHKKYIQQYIIHIRPYVKQYK